MRLKQKNDFLTKKRVMIEGAHKTKRNYKDKDWKRPITIVLRLANFKDKTIILKNVSKLKGSDVYINENFSNFSHRVNLLYFNYCSIIPRDRGNNNLTNLSSLFF